LKHRTESYYGVTNTEQFYRTVRPCVICVWRIYCPF